MRYTVTKQLIQVIGVIWMPMVEAAQEIKLSAYDMENIGDPRNRDDVERWLLSHSGDFSKIIDFSANFTIDDKDVVHNWSSEDSEVTFDYLMYGVYDDE